MDLQTKPLVDIIKELSLLDSEIEYKVLQYNALADEVLRRFPVRELAESLKQKEVIENDRNLGNTIQNNKALGLKRDK